MLKKFIKLEAIGSLLFCIIFVVWSFYIVPLNTALNSLFTLTILTTVLGILGTSVLQLIRYLTDIKEEN